MKIEITGRVASKKNQRTGLRRGGKYIVIYSKAWKRFEKSALKQIKAQYKKKSPLKAPYDITYIFNMRGKGATDVDNMIAGINDCLEKAGVIENDKHVHSGCFNKIIGSKDYITKVEICEL